MIVGHVWYRLIIYTIRQDNSEEIVFFYGEKYASWEQITLRLARISDTHRNKYPIEVISQKRYITPTMRKVLSSEIRDSNEKLD